MWGGRGGVEISDDVRLIFGTRKVQRKENREEKWKERKFWGKIKNRFKLNKLCVYSNPIYLFLILKYVKF